MDVFQILPFISTSFILISAILVAIGWVLIIQGKREAHKRVMLMAAAAALIFFIMYVARIVLLGSTPYAGPDWLKPYYLVFLLCHIVLATMAGVFGLVTISLGYREKYAKHRKIGRVTSIMWFITAISGVTVYTILYVLYPTEHKKSLLDAIFGG
ncbi:DUF420 domain-containing protein [Paenibacillus gansuensis]|uniref:DUF420 domain-containing protein n=1 Tax=Paenibacillus gansuensis TaxID=306542 RepID=A0ABW5PJA0_9BACL